MESFNYSTEYYYEENINITYSRSQAVYESVYFYLYGYGLPTICLCGFLGNVINIIILASKQTLISLR